MADIPEADTNKKWSWTSLKCFWADVSRAYMDPALWGRPNDQAKTLPEQWRLHTSTWRYLSSLLPYLGPPSNSLAHIGLPVASVLLLCVLIEVLDHHIIWKLDVYNNYAYLFRMSSFMLSLLLAFRLNRTYDRWWMARTSFGGIGGGVVNIVRQVATWTDDDVLVRQYQKWGMCMVYGIVQLVKSTPKQIDPRVKLLLLDAGELALYQGSSKPAKLCGTMLGVLTAEGGFGTERELLLTQMLSAVAANCSGCARIKLQALPYAMSLFCTGYMFIWLLLLPFGIFPEANWSALLPVFVMSTMMLALEDVAAQMEDPYKFIPVEALVATTAKDMPRTLREVRACQELMRRQYEPLRSLDASTDAAGKAGVLPPWPHLPARHQPS